MENSIMLAFNGLFIFTVCIVHEWKAIRRKADFDPLFMVSAFVGFSMLGMGIVGIISSITGGSNGQ